VKNTSEAATRPTRAERLVRTAALVSLGPAFLLTTPIEPDVTALGAACVLSGSLVAASSFPRLLAPRLGRAGGVLATSLVLGLVGTVLGVLEGCSFGAAVCRQAAGAWTLVWMSLPLLAALLAGFGRLAVALPVRAGGCARRVAGRLLRR